MKRISVGVPVRPWISSTPLRPPGMWNSTFLIMYYPVTLSCNYPTDRFTNTLNAGPTGQGHTARHRSCRQPAAQGNALAEDEAARDHDAAVRQRHERERDAQPRHAQRREPQRDLDHVDQDAGDDPRRHQQTAEESAQAARGYRSGLVADAELEADLAADVAQHGAEQQRQDQHRADFSIVTSSSLFVASLRASIPASARRCGWSERDSQRLKQFVCAIGENSPQMSAPMMRLRAPTASMIRSNADSGMRPWSQFVSASRSSSTSLSMLSHTASVVTSEIIASSAVSRPVPRSASTRFCQWMRPFSQCRPGPSATRRQTLDGTC